MTTYEENQLLYLEMLKQRTDIRIDCAVNKLPYTEAIELTFNGLQITTTIGVHNELSCNNNLGIDDCNISERLIEHYKWLREHFDDRLKRLRASKNEGGTIRE